MQGAGEVIPFERGSVPAVREDYVEAIQLWCKTHDTAEILSREELGAMPHKERMDAQRKALILALAQYYRNHERADVAPGVLAIITILSDNERGCATISQPTLAKLFGRSESSIRDAQKRLKDDSLITMTRGRFAGSTPVIPRIVTQHYNHVTWIVGALADANKPLNLPVPPADCQSEGPAGGLKLSDLQSAGPTGGMKLLNPPVEDISIRRPDARLLLSKNSKIGEAAKIAATGVAVALSAMPVAAEQHPVVEQVCEVPAECWRTPALQQMAALDVHELRAQRQVWITPSGMLHVAGAFKAELADTFPLVDLVSGLAASSENSKRNVHRGALHVMPVIIRQFGFMQQDALRRQATAKARQAADPPKKTTEDAWFDKLCREEGL
jgi:hypothetical protein